jgi:hypothetical protein
MVLLSATGSAGVLVCRIFAKDFSHRQTGEDACAPEVNSMPPLRGNGIELRRRQASYQTDEDRFSQI